ncbi:MAG: sugar phosphate isomerase/epimerase [Acidobacteria bacterium]|nr:sugar phosphate isomerase/epimerase [Acidobacteriota bacterium]
MVITPEAAPANGHGSGTSRTPMPTRREFLAAATIPAVLGTHGVVSTAPAAHASVVPGLPSRIKTSCNLYSFNGPLTRGEMTLEQVIEYCAEIGFDAVDPTGYYFTGYPSVPADELIHRIKHLAFSMGLAISGTGVRNDFAVPDAVKRDADVAHVSRWVDVAARLGAPVLRVFDGRVMPPDVSKATVMDWIVDGIRRCVDAARARGVIIVLQNHNDALKEAGDYLTIRERIPSPWFGLNVDIGSLRLTDDPYAEIATLAPHACTWQVKELVYRRNVEERVDLRQIARILRDARYRGYVPIETLGPEDPRITVRAFLDEFRAAVGVA